MGNDLRSRAPCGDLPKGLPVLVYSTDSPSSHCLCNLVLDHSEDHMQLTLYLQHSIFINDFDSEQMFIFQYEADNFKPGTTSITSRDPVGIDPTKLNQIVRQTKHKIQTLSITLKEACPVWCPISAGVLAPKEEYAKPFYELAALAQATNIHIVFDQNQLREKRRASLEHLIECSEKYTGFGISRRCFKNYDRKDWKIFGTNGLLSEAPPPYTCSDENPTAFARWPTPEPPTSIDHLSKPVPASEPSTTEKATTTLHLSSETPCSPPVNLPDFDLNAFDFQNVVRNSVNAVFSEWLTATPSLPTVLEPLFNDLLNKFFENALYRAQDELVDAAEVHRLDIDQTREDSCLEANEMFHKMLETLESSMAARLESFEERANDTCDEVLRRLDGTDDIRSLNELMRREQEWVGKVNKSKTERRKLRIERKKLKKERKLLKEERRRTKEEMKHLKWELKTETKYFLKERKRLKTERVRSKELDKQEVGLELRHIKIRTREKLGTS